MKGKTRQQKSYKAFISTTWLLLVGVLMSVSSIAIGQTKYTDSLHAVLDTTSSDSARIATLYNLSWNCIFSEADTARRYARTMMSIAQEIGHSTGIGNGLNLLGISHDVEGRYDSSLHYFLSYLAHTKAQGDLKNQARANNNLSIVYQNIGENKFSLAYTKQSLRIEEILRDSIGMAESLTNMGHQFSALGHYDSALVAFDRSQQLLRQLGNTALMAYNYEGYAEITISQQQYQAAIDSLALALIQWEAENNDFHYATSSLMLGRAYLGLNQMDLTFEALTQAKELATTIEAHALLMGSYKSLAKWHEIQQQPQEALNYLNLYTQSLQTTFNQSKANHLAAIEAQHNYNAKDQEIAWLNKERTIKEKELTFNRQVRNILFISIGLLLTFMLIIVRNYWRTVRTNKMLEIKREEIKKKNLEIVHQKYKALRASKAKSRFLAMMSHEIRTPMNAVIGITNLLLQENPRKDQQESLQTMKFSAENLLVLINDILDYNKIEAGKIDFESIPFDLKSLLISLQNSMKGKANEKHLNLTMDLDQQLPSFIKGDPTRLAQILTNLLSNAIKFTEKGSVTLKVEMVGETDDKYHLAYTVSDTGIGISREKLGSIFDSFTQASSDITRKYGGTGLGLSITRKLVELQGSRIRVESQPGEGTQFYFTLPFERTNQRPIELFSDEVLPTRDLNGVKVLIAEDNKVNEIVATRFLTKWGVEVDAVPDGLQAVKQVQEREYDLVLMDLQMPVLDGFKATRKIRNLADSGYSALPIIALTASAMNEVRQKAFEAGVTDFVTKPFNPEELRAILEKYILHDDTELIGQEY